MMPARVPLAPPPLCQYQHHHQPLHLQVGAPGEEASQHQSQTPTSSRHGQRVPHFYRPQVDPHVQHMLWQSIPQPASQYQAPRSVPEVQPHVPHNPWPVPQKGSQYQAPRSVPQVHPHVPHNPWPIPQKGSQYQAPRSVPRGPPHVPPHQQRPYMHPSPPSILPQGPVRGTEQVVAPQSMRNTWQQLDAVIDTARSMKACTGFRGDVFVPGDVTQKLTVAVAILADASLVLEQWMQGPGVRACEDATAWMQGTGAVIPVTTPELALAPEADTQLPPDIGISTQDGWDPVEAARAGRLDRLRRLQRAGRVLDLNSPLRVAAGDARRAEAWLAALAACKGGHAHVLRWLFRGGWPRSFDADPPWHLRDMAESWIKEFGTTPKQGFAPPCLSGLWSQLELSNFPPEMELYRSAVRTPACLDALLEAGARSPWICYAIVLEGKADLLEVAVASGCPCDAECLFSAAREGQVEVLEAVLNVGWHSILETAKRPLTLIIMQPLYPENPQWLSTGVNLLQQAGMEAAARGQGACLEALLRQYPDLLCDFPAVAQAAAHAGQLSCLQILLRGGLKKWWRVTTAAAGKHNNVHCLHFAIQMERSFIEHGFSCFAMREAAQAGSSENLRALHEAGCRWDGREVEYAIRSGNLEAVKFCLEHFDEEVAGGGVNSRTAMTTAIKAARCPAIMQLLYEAGFPPDCMRGGEHPAVMAIAEGMLEGAQIAVKYSGVPEQRLLNTSAATLKGAALLRYVHELGGTLHPGTAVTAARSGQLGALQYAMQNGCPWDRRLLGAALQADSLDCLRYAHEHEGGCPRNQIFQVFTAARSFPVLRYVCEHMGPTWSAGVLRLTVAHVASTISQTKHEESLDWKIALYTVQQFLRSGEPGMRWEDLPADLADSVLVRRERGAALSRAFFKAGQLGQVQAAHPWARVWRSMAGVPCELREKIAYKAHLVLPPKGLC